ncbi:hypothetical protein QW131_09310 [Roseibium salinum]|nr:hypothetical protein [Roseibium salinum]
MIVFIIGGRQNGMLSAERGRTDKAGNNRQIFFCAAHLSSRTALRSLFKILKPNSSNSSSELSKTTSGGMDQPTGIIDHPHFS